MSGPEVFAHRGFSRDGNENSVRAFRDAVALGVRWVETDVNTTADGVVVAVHDPSLERVAGVPGRVTEMTWEQVRRVRLAGGERIPSLVEALEALPEACFNVDIKDEASVAAFPAAVVRAGAVHRVRVASFSESRRRRVLDALVRCGAVGSAEEVLSSPGVLGTGLFLLVSTVLPAAACRVVWPVVARCARRWVAPFDRFQVPEFQQVGPVRVPVATERLVRAAHACGYAVDVWTVNDVADMRRLAAWGVDGLVTDRADLAVRVG